MSEGSNRAPSLPPAASPSKPPWMLTPPPSAEKSRGSRPADPRSPSVVPAVTPTYDAEPNYFTYLDQITSATYRDPAIPSTPLAPVQVPSEPLFLPDDEDDDIQMGTDNRMVLFDRPSSPTPNGLIKRPHEDEDIEFTGAILPVDGIVDFGKPIKRRRVKHEKAAQAPEECEEEDDESQLQEVEEDLREVEALQRGCQACGCFCNTVGSAPRRSGSGSTTLSPRVLGDLLHMLMGSGNSLLLVASRMHPGIQTWADIAERVGARREDFDRVRHAASGMQSTLPVKKARGEF